jgi:hypothetical protein
MENFIWLNDPLDPGLSQQLTGKFQAYSDWAACELDLCLSPEGILTGQFDVGGQLLQVKGGIGKRGVVYGFLLEPVASVPVALFRIKPGDNLDLELDVPDFDTLLDHCSPQQVRFERVAVNRAIENRAVDIAAIGQVDVSAKHVDIKHTGISQVDIKHTQTGLLSKGA